MKMEVTIGRVPIIRPSDNILSTHYNTLSKVKLYISKHRS